MQTIEETTCTPDYSNSMVGHLGITFLPSDDGKVYAEMPVDRRTSQPFGMLNGGASLALAEIVAGHGSLQLCQPGEYACGVQVSGNHISTVAVGGKVLAKGELIHKGSSSHIWNVDITTPEGKLVSTVRVVNFIIAKR
ncbi:PaaI family thioesterase [Phocaeicola sp.]